MNKIKEFKYVSYLYRTIFENYPEGWYLIPLEGRAQILMEWDRMRQLEEVGLINKAKTFRFVIFLSLIMAALAGSAMICLIVIANDHYSPNRPATLFGIQMLVFLAIHFMAVFWRWLWSKKLEKLALYIPVEYE